MLLFYHYWMFYNHFIATLYHFFGTNLLTQCTVPVAIFWLFFYIAGNQYQTESKHRETPRRFFMDQKIPIGPGQHLGGGCPKGCTTNQVPPGSPGAPRWVVPTSVASRTPSLHYKFPKYFETHQG